MGRKIPDGASGAALRVNNGLLMRDAAVAGLGIALLPAFLLDTALKKRTLKVIDIGAEAEGATIYIAYPEHLRSSGEKFAPLTEWLQKSFGDPAYWIWLCQSVVGPCGSAVMLPRHSRSVVSGGASQCKRWVFQTCTRETHALSISRFALTISRGGFTVIQAVSCTACLSRRAKVRMRMLTV